MSYDKARSFQQTTGTSMINGLAIETGSTVLDLGCGTAWLPHKSAVRAPELDHLAREDGGGCRP